MPHHLALARLPFRLDASGLGHAKRSGVFASIPDGIAPRCEAAGKSCKSGNAMQHTNRQSSARCFACEGSNILAAPIKKTCPFEFPRHGRPKAGTETRPAFLPSEVSQGESQKGKYRFSGARGYAPERAKRLSPEMLPAIQHAAPTSIWALNQAPTAGGATATLPVWLQPTRAQESVCRL